MEYKRVREAVAVPRERRLNMRLMAFWWDRRADRDLPSIEDFDPEDLSDVWHHCFTLNPRDPRGKWAFQYVGGTIAEQSGVAGSEITLDEVASNTLLDHATRSVNEVVQQKVPVIHSGQFVDETGATVMFRSILLPLSRDQTAVDCVVGGARCRVVPLAKAPRPRKSAKSAKSANAGKSAKSGKAGAAARPRRPSQAKQAKRPATSRKSGRAG